MARLGEILRYLRQSLWFIPALMAIGALALAGVLVFVDTELTEAGSDIPFVYAGSAEGAREMLSTIAISMLTFTGLVFTITMLVLQSASNQLSPRVVRTFLRDRGNQLVLGLFVATFLFALVVLRYTRSAVEDGAELVPGISIGVAFVMLLASIGAFIYYIDHMAQAIRASTVIQNIAVETRSVLEHLFPELIGEPADGEGSDQTAGGSSEALVGAMPADPPAALVRAPSSGVIVGMDEDGLLEAAGGADSTDGDAASGERFVEMVPMVGDYVVEGSPLFRVWGSWDEGQLDGLRRAVEMGNERTLDADAAFGLVQLVDIALRALSPGINDPTTAVQALDRIHDLLHRLAQRRIPSPLRHDPGGRARLYLPRQGWDDYVVLAVEEIRLSGEGQLHVMRRLRQMLLDVRTVAPADRRRALDSAIERVDRSAARGLDDAFDQAIADAERPYGQGPMAS